MISVVLFFINRRMGKGDKCRDNIAKDLTGFIEDQKETYDLMHLHQSGRPCDGSRSFVTSREKISQALKSLTDVRIRTEFLLSNETAEEWLVAHLIWKDVMLGDGGFLTDKSAVCPRRLMAMESAQKGYTAFLITMRQRIASGKDPIAKV